ncbi:hypothetical protein NXW78_28125 [Bacteroides ovatus]|nr:hypothetical protein [Bacteroides ovatus]
MEAIAADMKYFLDRNLSEQLDPGPVSPPFTRAGVPQSGEPSGRNHVATHRTGAEINRSGNMNGHSTSVDRQTVQVERGTLTPEQPSAEARPTAAKTTPEPVMSLYDLFGFTQEERSQVRKRKTRRKKEDSGQLSLFDMPPLEQHSAMQTVPTEPAPKRKNGRSRNVRNGNAAGRRKRPHVRSA